MVSNNVNLRSDTIKTDTTNFGWRELLLDV
jgi:hypothetical protein